MQSFPYPSKRKCLIVGLHTSLILSLVGWQVTARSSQQFSYPHTHLLQTSPTEQLEQELAIAKTRAQQFPNSGLEQTALATTYLKWAKAKGNSHWYHLAEQTAQTALDKLPFSNLGAHLVLGRVAAAQHDFPEAIQRANMVLIQQPGQAEAVALLVTSNLALGNVSTAQQQATKLVNQIANLNSLTLLALSHEAAGDLETAETHFKAAIAAEEAGEIGSSVYTRTVFGRFYAHQGQIASARALYQSALEILPQYAPALTQLAQLETQAGHYQKARSLYQQVFSSTLAAATVDHTAQIGMAELALLQGNRVEAQEWFHRAEDNFRHHHELDTFGHQRELASLLLLRGQEPDRTEALQLMQQEVTLRRDTETLEHLAWALSATGQLTDAQTIITEAIATNPNHALSHYRAAAIAAQLGQASLAQTHLQTAKALNPHLQPKRLRLRSIDLSQITGNPHHA